MAWWHFTSGSLLCPKSNSPQRLAVAEAAGRGPFKNSDRNSELQNRRNQEVGRPRDRKPNVPWPDAEAGRQLVGQLKRTMGGYEFRAADFSWTTRRAAWSDSNSSNHDSRIQSGRIQLDDKTMLFGRTATAAMTIHEFRAAEFSWTLKRRCLVGQQQEQ